MPMIQPDLTEVVELGPIEPGTYKAKVVSVETGVSGKGNPKIVVKFDVFAGGDKPRPRSAHLAISGAGAYGFDQLLRACHFDAIADAFKTPGDNKPPFDTDSLIGQEVNLAIDSDMYQDKKTDKIVAYLKV